MDRKSFIIPYILSYNRYRVKITALANTRANAFALLNTVYAQKLLEFLSVPFKTLKQPVLFRGFDGYAGMSIT